MAKGPRTVVLSDGHDIEKHKTTLLAGCHIEIVGNMCTHEFYWSLIHPALQQSGTTVNPGLVITS
mgnify:FL=1|jgi:hypothetical protein